MRVHFIGINGVSMNFLARLCKEAGLEVTGSDLTTGGHCAKNVAGADAVVYSFAIDSRNEELVEAHRSGIPTFSRAELLGAIAARYRTVVAVSGTHGKTTTTAMLMSALEPLDPTVHVGGSVRGKFGRIGGKELFVTEACEYRESFLTLSPDYAIVLNVELDHADYYKTYANFYDAFEKFTARSKVAFVCGDNEARGLKGISETYTFGMGEANDYRAVIVSEARGYYTFDALFKGKKFAELTLGVRGAHNVTDAMAAIAYCHRTGVDFDGLSNFHGVDRRFETLAERDGVEYISDYAHHPHEIECTLAAAKRVHDRVLAVFEPHTYTRTQAFCKEFAAALSKADKCILLPIYPAREAPIEGVSSGLIAEEGGFDVADSYAVAADMLDKENGFDAVLFLGAGTVDEFARDYVRRLG